MSERFSRIAPTLGFLIIVSLVAIPVSKEMFPLIQPNLSWFHYITGVGLIVLFIIFISALIYLLVKGVILTIFLVAAATLMFFQSATKLFIHGRKDKRKSTLRRLLRLFLTEEDEENIVGDLFEEFAEIAVKHGEWYAKVWYYKQVAASAWPLVRTAVRWGILAWIGEWVRRRI